MTPNELIDQAKTKIEGTNANLARRLKISRSLVTGWNRSNVPIPDHHIVSLANLAGLDPTQMLAEIKAHWAATTEAPAEVKAAWTELAHRSAAAFIVTVTTLGHGLNTEGNPCDPSARGGMADNAKNGNRRKFRAEPWTGEERRAA